MLIMQTDASLQHGRMRHSTDKDKEAECQEISELTSRNVRTQSNIEHTHFKREPPLRRIHIDHCKNYMALQESKSQCPSVMSMIDRFEACTVRDEKAFSGTGIGALQEKDLLPCLVEKKRNLIERHASGEDSNSRSTSVPNCSRKLETLNKTSEPVQKLYNVALELLLTERAYVQRLHLLDKVFYSRLMEEAKSKSSFPTETINGIFSNLSSILQFHEHFLLPELEGRMDNWKENPQIGDILQKLLPFLKMYGEYVKNFDHAMGLLNTWLQRSVQFKSIVQEIQGQEESRNLTLQHHMLEPIQRIPRYELLLSTYIKDLPPDSPDYKNAQKSLQIISTAANHSNAAIRKNEKMQKLLEIHELLDGGIDVVHPSNELIKEGPIFKLSARNGVPQERYLFLFNNMLLHCVPKMRLMRTKFSVRTCLDIADLKVVDDMKNEEASTFHIYGKQRALDIQTRTQKEKQEWMEALQDVITKYEINMKSFKDHCKEEEEEEEEEKEENVEHLFELGKRAPQWIHDMDTTMCMKCKELFNTITRRRHHCRACGHVVCAKCSESRHYLEYEPSKPQRVCKECYAHLTSNYEQENTAQQKEQRILEMEGAFANDNSIMSGFLQFFEQGRRQTWQKAWFTLPKSDPLVLYMYGAQQDVKALNTFSLPQYEVRKLEPKDIGENRCGFRLSQSHRALLFVTDTEKAAVAWLYLLYRATSGKITTDDDDVELFDDDFDSDLESEEEA
uniref:FYVE, RhoGEF and PH domain-containing protein 2-like n=1 Tax=Myxine glutinosa TaxID=7769 RepID=UPI00358E03FA